MSSIGSGLDINGIVASLVSIERKSRITPLQVKQVNLNAKLSLYGQMKSAFSKFEDSSKKVLSAFTKYQAAYAAAEKKTITNNGDGTVTIFTPGNGEAQFLNTKTTSNSDPAVVNLNSNPTYGTYQINVINRNEAQEYRVSTGTSDPNALFGGGTLDISFANGRNESVSFGQQLTRNDVDNDSTTQQIIDKINSSNVGITASFDSATGELVLTGTNAGAANAFTLNARNEVDQRAQGFNPEFGPNDGNDNNNTGFSRIARGTVTNTAKDTTVSINDGSGAQTFSSFSGTFVQSGLDFTVTGLGFTEIRTFDRQDPNPDYVGPTSETRAFQAGDPQPGETRVLTAPSSAELTKELDAFIADYNALISRLKKSQEKGDDLDRDTTPFRLEAKIRDIFNQVVGGTETKLDLGFSISKEGVLSLNKDKLAAKLVNDPDAFKRIFADAIGKDFVAYSKQVNENGGALKAKSDSLTRTVDSVKAKSLSEEFRIGRLEKIYRAQFVALDKVLTDLQVSQGFLSQGLANLQGFSQQN
ncbi:hypothetical protein CL689_03995 [Candidatus Saccharibacteria bacterium]|nr:hypothetical protein [Candidatus Saccharibacteria bacterium]|tara:strand:+ start:1450 stop:3036 length:1587 start_codon:yes stop_codon:yes gene_type:complete